MKTACTVALCGLAMALSGCVSFDSSSRTIGPATEHSETDRKMEGKVTLVELDNDGFEQSRTDDPSAVFKGLGLSESAIAAASASDADPHLASLDYMRFEEAKGFAKGQYPVGRRGHRRLEFEFPSPSKRCESMKYNLRVQWSWKANRVTRSEISGDWNGSMATACMKGQMRAERVDELSGSLRRIGMIKYNIFIDFHVPVEDLETAEIVSPASLDEKHYFGGAGVSVRGDGTARFNGTYGLAGE